jgi:ferredoxin-NADP reductase
MHEMAQNSALFAGGIGMTPILAMAWRLHELGNKFVWHLSAHSRERLAWANQIDAFPFRNAIRLHLSDAKPSQYLDAARVMRDLPPTTHIYICGPRGYMDYVAEDASKRCPSRRLPLRRLLRTAAPIAEPMRELPHGASERRQARLNEAGRVADRPGSHQRIHVH